MKRPDLHQLADLAQIIGAVGVVVSLLYVAGELRQNTNAIRAGTFQDMTAMTVQLRADLVSDSSFAAIVEKVTERESLTATERVRLEAWFAAVLRQFENLHYQYGSGTLDASMWKGYDQLIRHSLADGPLRQWYEAHEDEYSDDFHAYVSTIDR